MKFTPGTNVEILERGNWVGPFVVTDKIGRTADHLVLSGPSGLFEVYNDAPYNVRPIDQNLARLEAIADGMPDDHDWSQYDK